ncbi:MAG: 5-formyltetrahydrofolate cyclo-ligase [Bacteroidetes bacterium]|nr:5-formyltetrahydrofolate cyclo-ligase [Bacteroidota bacterium]
MKKLDARIKYRDARNLLTSDKVDIMSQQIFNNFFKEFDASEYSCIHYFKSISKLKEVNTAFFEKVMYEKFPQVKLATSVTDINSTLLTHYTIDQNTTFKENLLRIPEPVNGKKISEKEINLVFVPMFVFDEVGHRVGYGKGYYDRFLRELTSECITVGLNFFPPVDLIEDASEFDISLNYCITPEKVYKFKK